MAFGQFRGLWRYASLYDLRVSCMAVLSSSAFYVLVRWIFAQPHYPRSIYLIDSLILIDAARRLPDGPAGVPRGAGARRAARGCSSSAPATPAR